MTGDCAAHPGQRAIARCNRCNRPLCGECVAARGNLCGDSCAAAKPAIVGAATKADPQRRRIRWITHAAAVAAVLAVGSWFFLGGKKGGPVAPEWAAPLEGRSAAAVFVAEERLYVLGDRGDVWEADPHRGTKLADVRGAMGEERWATTIGLAGDVLVEADFEGLRGWSLSKRQVAWSAKGVRPIHESEENWSSISWFARGVAPLDRIHGLLDDGGAAQLVALDAKSGREAWRGPLALGDLRRIDASHGWVATIVPGAKRKRELVLYSARDGKRAWAAAVSDETARPVVTKKGVVVIGSEGIDVRDLGDGRSLWSLEFPDYRSVAVPAVREVEGDILIAAAGAVSRVEIATGKPVWFARGPETFSGWLPYGGRLVIAGSSGKALVAGLREPLLATAECSLVQQIVREPQMARIEHMVVYAMEPRTGRTAWLIAQAGGGMELVGGDLILHGPDEPKMYELIIDPHKVVGSPGQQPKFTQTLRLVEVDGSVRWEHATDSTSNFARIGERIVFARHGGEAALVALRAK